MDIQKLMDAMNEATRQTRSGYHLTLGGLIDALECNPNFEVAFDTGEGLGEEHSYRGHYSDLAFEAGKPCLASALSRRMKAAAGSTYTGYKGGDFTMGLDTPLWRASYGNTGLAVIGANIEGSRIVLVTKELPE